MKLQQNKTKRRRGVVLTPVGLQRLQEAIVSWEIVNNKGDRLTLEQLSRQINVSTKTLSRLWSLNASVDHKTLKLCFGAFNLEVYENDYTVLTEEHETELPELPSESSSIQTHNLDKLFTEAEEYRTTYPDGVVLLDSSFYIAVSYTFLMLPTIHSV
ncbi:hypothetical protein WDZ92_50920 [Nostoc sp. NIES-2111]